MEGCDALIVGGGPAGSSCAWRLHRDGAQPIVIDAAFFPRDKVCAGWTTAATFHGLQLDADDYRHCKRPGSCEMCCSTDGF